MTENNLTIFLVKNRALGDSIMGLSTVSYFRKLYPKSTIIYAVPQWTARLYDKIETDADLIYPLKLNSMNDILNLYTDLINLNVTNIHEMHQTGTGKKLFSFFASIKGIHYTAHNHHLVGQSKVLDQGEKKEIIQRDLDGVYSFYGKHKSIPSFLNFPPVLKFKNKLGKKKKIIFGVVATRQTKMWPLESFIELGECILKKYPDFEISIPLSSSSEDKLIKEKLLTLINDSRIKIVHIGLDDLPQFFKESLLYVGNDTGLKHLAVATEIPTVTMFGPEPIREWHPYEKEKNFPFYIENLPCRTRTHHYCGLSICDLEKIENKQCLTKISSQLVFEKVAELLSKIWT